MNAAPPLDDCLAFLAVARAGSLSGATAATGQSAPTLGRKMAAVERWAGRRLFHRGQDGYALTAEGRALRDELADLDRTRQRLAGWAAGTGPVTVRVTSGTWTALWLARRMADWWSPDAPWVPEFRTANAALDIARREADIGFRNRRPDQPWLAGRRTRRIAYAEYGTAAVTGYVALAPDLPGTPSSRWVRAHRADRIVTTVSDARLGLDLARAGVGRVVLPTFAGDAEPGLSRLSDEIAALAHDEWLVAHHEARHDPPVRAALDALARIARPG